MKKMTLKEIKTIYDKVNQWKDFTSQDQSTIYDYLGMSRNEWSDFYLGHYQITCDLEGKDNHILKDLEEYINLEGTEVGETVSCLVGLWSRRDYISEDLKKFLEQEIVKYYIDFTNNYKIVTKIETIERKIKYLEEA